MEAPYKSSTLKSKKHLHWSHLRGGDRQNNILWYWRLYTPTQKFSNFLQQCIYIQTSVNCFNKTSIGQVEGLFTGKPPSNMQSISHICYTAWWTHKKHAQRVQKLPFCQYYITVEQFRFSIHQTHTAWWESLSLAQHAIARHFWVSVCSQQALSQVITTIIQVFIKYKILSREITLNRHTYTHIGAPTHKYIYYTQFTNHFNNVQVNCMKT